MVTKSRTEKQDSAPASRMGKPVPRRWVIGPRRRPPSPRRAGGVVHAFRAIMKRAEDVADTHEIRRRLRTPGERESIPWAEAKKHLGL